VGIDALDAHHNRHVVDLNERVCGFSRIALSL